MDRLTMGKLTAFCHLFHVLTCLSSYWTTDVLNLNPHFGTSDDLKALSDALHARGMFLMVDVVVNFVASLSTDTSDAALASQDTPFKKAEYFHPKCWIDYSNQISAEQCWMGDDKVALMDLNTENAFVQETMNQMIKDLVATYQIDGLRIDAAKHVPQAFLKSFCASAGVFCTGEVYTGDTP
jgi:alpha-amylase